MRSDYGDGYVGLAEGWSPDGGIAISFPESVLAAYTLAIRFRIRKWGPSVCSSGPWSLGYEPFKNVGPMVLVYGATGPIESEPRGIELDRIYTATLTSHPDEGHRLFQDGAWQGMATATQYPNRVPLEWPLWLGTNPFPGHPITGAMDFFDVRLWQGRLSDAEIAADHERFDPDREDLVARIDFTRGAPAIHSGIHHPAPPIVALGSTATIVGLPPKPPEPVPEPGPDLRDIARALAPVVHLHPDDYHRPSSVEWFLQRCEVLEGKITVATTGLKMTGWPPEGVTKLGWAWPLDLSTVSIGNSWNSKENNNVGLSPKRAQSNRAFASVYSEAQLEALYGEPTLTAPVGAGVGASKSSEICSSTCYCHITEADKIFTFTYYFFYPYNGGMGTPMSYSEPLGMGSGYYAHIGDWERVSIRVSLHEDGTVWRRQAIYEHHGDEFVVDYPGEERLAFDELRPLTVYSCWHSHASWPTPGSHPTDVALVNDVAAEGGPKWRTGDHLEFISSKSGGWVAYNGLFGANVRAETVPTVPDQKNGPEGPAYHGSWTKYGAEWFPPG